MKRGTTSLGFGLVYYRRLVYCEVIIGEERVLVLFNSYYVSEIILDENNRWKSIGGAKLPQKVLKEIGNHIENHFA